MSEVNLMADNQSECSHTPGPWKTDACGGFSTVVSMTQPMRADTRIGAYGYDPRRGHCIGYPFIEDDGKVKRIDFVCFSHEDACLIAAAPDLLAALKEMGDWIAGGLQASDEAWPDAKCLQHTEEIAARARAAVAKAEGRS